MGERRFFVYILASERKTLYTGVTNNLPARLLQHRNGTGSAFTARYGISRLVYFEEAPTAYDAISREKQVKVWTRAKRVALITSENPEWDDLGPTVLN